MVYVFLVQDFELVEALGTVDVLRRAKVDVTTVSITSSKEVLSSTQVYVIADKLYAECDFQDAEAVILPGGPGVSNILECKGACDLFVDLYAMKKLVCAICAAPKVLYGLGINAKCTVFPALKDELPNYVGGKVVREENYITGEAMGATLDFALEIVKCLEGESVAEEVEISIAK